MRRGVFLIMLAAACLSPGAAAQEEKQPAPAGSAETVQQLFTAGSAAYDAGRNDEALAIFTRLEQRVAKSRRSTAIVSLRKGLVLFRLLRLQEAKEALTSGLAGLPTADPSLAYDRYRGELTLAQVVGEDLDYVAALDHLDRAALLATDVTERLAVLIPQVEYGTFVDPDTALARMDEIQAVMATQPEKLSEVRARIAVARGRLLLNLGRFDEAEETFAAAVSKLGGLTLKVDYNNIITRSDAAIAAMLANHKDKAISYLVYTGAGRLPKQDFTTGADMALPICGVDGVAPDDVAIIEFGIEGDGSVSYARPVYGSRQGGMALIFARAVAGWSWRPEEVKDIPPLFRLLTRLELRCSTGGTGPDIPAGPGKAFAAWLEARGVAGFEPEGQTEVARRAALLKEFGRRKAAGGDGMALLPILSGLLDNPVVSKDDDRAYAASFREIILDHDPPPLVRLLAEIHYAKANRSPRNMFDTTMIDEAPHQKDAQALATLRLVRFDYLPSSKRTTDLLDSVVGDSRLAADDPLRVGALVRRASLNAMREDMAAARADYAATGLTDQQCALVDARPAMRHSGADSSDYPTEMLRQGVTGWARTEFDIRADGRTSNRRIVVAYPPFVFDKATLGVTADARFEQSYRPSGAAGCTGFSRTVIYRMP